MLYNGDNAGKQTRKNKHEYKKIFTIFLEGLVLVKSFESKYLPNNLKGLI